VSVVGAAVESLDDESADGVAGAGCAFEAPAMVGIVGIVPIESS
jgi:hypothetical protein